MMKWEMEMEMEMEEIEAVLERIWDLHDRISDAIHAISRTHFLKSIKNPSPEGTNQSPAIAGADDGVGFVFVKGFAAAVDENAAAEARSLNAIRTALENLEDQLDFFHSVRSQQRAERDAAIARLEQSRIILAMRLADHQGKKYKVIEEALAFVGNVHDSGRFVAPENLYEMPRSHSGENISHCEGKGLHALMQLLKSSFEIVKRSIKLERMGGALGNAALFAASMFALLQLHHHVAFKGETPQLQPQTFYRKTQAENSSHFDVFAGRG